MRVSTGLLGLAMLVSAAAGLKAYTGNASQDHNSKDVRTPVLLELFTSEGCSSCPPADRLLESLDEKQPIAGADLIVLSEHVDYWNHLGWSDPFSAKTFSLRQQQYAEQLGTDDIYTPQVVIDGSQETVGSNSGQIRERVAKALAQAKTSLTLTDIERDGKQLKLHASSAALDPGAGPATLYIVVALGKVRSDVRRGENSGRSLEHVAVVKSISPVATLSGGSSLSKDLTIQLPQASSDLRVVAFLQNNKSKQIVGATQTKL